MRNLIIATVCMLFLSACEQQVENPGIYLCTSNAGQPDLWVHTDDMKLVMQLDGTGTLTFTELYTGVRYVLHSVEDRDYSCDIQEQSS